MDSEVQVYTSRIPESQLESVSQEGLLGMCARSPVELYFLLRLLVLAVIYTPSACIQIL